MKKQLFNQSWNVKNGVQGPFEVLFQGLEEGKPVTLPHDAMIEEERDPDCPSGAQSGFYPARSYTYVKKFFAPREWETLKTLVEFEGVMQKALSHLLRPGPCRRTGRAECGLTMRNAL